MKKFIAILLTFSLLLTLTACGGSSPTSTNNAEPAQGEAASESVPEAVPESASESNQEAAPETAPEVVTETTQEAVTEAAQTASTDADATQTAAADAALTAATDSAQTAATDAAQTAVTEAATDAAPESAAKTETAVGSYKLTGLTSESGSNLEIVSIVVDMGVSFFLSLTEDNTGNINFMEAKIPLDWDDSSIMIQTGTNDNGTDPLSIPYTYAGDSLQIRTPAYSMEFTRLTDKELADYEENGTGSLNGLLSTMVQGLIDSMDGDLVSSLILGLGQGLDEGEEAIPEGEPSKEPVSGIVDGQEFNILGADHIQGDEGELIVFYYDVTNKTDDFRYSWDYNFSASQGGSFLEDVYLMDGIPEVDYSSLEIAPGRTIRCASVFVFDPEGGTVGFRIGHYEEESTVLYYADPGNLTGAPEPFVFDTDPSIPQFLERLPDESEDVHIENAEFFTDSDGNGAIRVFFRFLNTSREENASFTNEHGCLAIQDGIELPGIWNDDAVDEEYNVAQEVGPGEEILCSYTYKVRTASPVVFVVYLEKEDGTHIPMIGYVIPVP